MGMGDRGPPAGERKKLHHKEYRTSHIIILMKHLSRNNSFVKAIYTLLIMPMS